jgi:3-deoxy-7-phosphoheptulonate synthase
VLRELPLPDASAELVASSRGEVVDILNGEDDRLLVVVGPCSIHDPEAAMDYARRLKTVADELRDDLCIVMRVYFEKPRTTVGWKGLINDPHLDGSCSCNEGLRIARELLLDILAVGMPAGCEFLDPISPQYISDLVSWGAIGARTTESQVHRQLASGLSMPIGFKNSTDGGVQIAIDAIRASSAPHSFFGVSEDGIGAIVTTTGNPDCHVILRGGLGGPNYSAASVGGVLEALEGTKLPRRVIVDASHGNSEKDHNRQPIVAEDVAGQLAEGQSGIVGMMLESFLVPGRQNLVTPEALTYGQSITDACIGWDVTVDVLNVLAEGVRRRRISVVSTAPERELARA